MADEYAGAVAVGAVAGLVGGNADTGLMVLVGQRKALAIAVRGARTRRRWSKLRDRLAVTES